jgi:hypothetical protein
MSLPENRPVDAGGEDEQRRGQSEASSDHLPHGDLTSSSSTRVDPVQESAPSPTLRTYNAPKGKRFSNKADREILLAIWIASVTSEGKMVPGQRYDERERKDFFAAWLRQLIADGELDPRRRLPPYDKLTGLPFHLSKKAIGEVINELRAEGLFPKRKKRKDAGQPQWRSRDTSCFWWIGEMRAIRSDQLRRLLARWSPGEPRESGQLSMTRTSQIIDRWVKAGYVVYRKIYVKQPGWVYLTRKGMQAANLPYRATPPADTMLTHIYYINEVRLAFEGHHLRLNDKVRLCEQSVSYAREAEDANTLVTALIELAIAYEYVRQPDSLKKRLITLQEALDQSRQASPLVQSRTYWQYSAVLAESGRIREAQFYIGLAQEVFPDDPTQDPGFALAEGNIFSFSYRAGLVHIHTGSTDQAFPAFEYYKQHPSGLVIPDRLRLLIANGQSQAAILDNDAERYADHLEDVLVGSVRIRSQKRFDEALQIFQEDMPASWLQVERIRQLAEQYGLKREQQKS